MKASFLNSVDVLIKAYMNDTLEHLNSCACAVGNLVAAAGGYRYTKIRGKNWWLGQHPFWNNWGNSTPEEAQKEYDLVGYTAKQIYRIEKAFEENNHIWHPERTEDENVYAGLLAVVDVLAEIHGVDLSTKESAVSRFVEVKTAK